MREIKFRAWDKDTKRMWDIETYHIADEYVDLIEPGKNIADINAERLWRKQSEIILMQFTGLHDKNERKIYESDILRVTTVEDGESYIATVKWFGDEGYPAFDLEGVPATRFYDANALSTIFNSGAETCEVIGNIHYTPELLEDKK